MAFSLSSPPSYLPQMPPRLKTLTPSPWSCCVPKPNPSPSPLLPFLLSSSIPSPKRGLQGGGLLRRRMASHLCEQEGLALDRRSLAIGETESDDELLAAVRLRIRTFYEFSQSYGIEDHKKYLVEREFEALKERILGKRVGFRRVACINATLPLSHSLSSAPDLCSACKFSENGEERVVIGTLDLNQCLRLADELTGKKPEGIEADITRAYLSNVCVAQELHRNGLGYALISTSKKVAQSWGLTDLYVHVAADNEAAKKLYAKSGFVYENEEPAWQARFLGRTRRFLLWADLKQKDM